jgi:hypothetical protein
MCALMSTHSSSVRIIGCGGPFFASLGGVQRFDRAMETGNYVINSMLYGIERATKDGTHPPSRRLQLAQQGPAENAPYRYLLGWSA